MKVKTLIGALIAAASLSAQAAPMAIDNMSLDSGTFNLGGVPGTPGAWGHPAVEDLTSGYLDLGSAFTFFGAPVYMFTGDGTMAPYGGAAVVGGPVISGTVDAGAGSITVDLSSFTAHWNGTNFNQGTPSATGVWNSGTGKYTVSWASTVVGGPFDGQTGNWSISGIANPVPEPETYAMMLAGLGLLGLAVRRRKAA